MKKPVKKLARLAEQFQAWALEESLPLWWKANRLANGAFYEALDFEGRPVPEPQARVRVQARQVYALALGWKLGFRKKSLPAKLESSIERFFDTCLGPEGLPGRIVNVENGELVDPRPELYNTGFALMALAQSRKVLGGRAVDGRIGRLFDRIDEHRLYFQNSKKYPIHHAFAVEPPEDQADPVDQQVDHALAPRHRQLRLLRLQFTDGRKDTIGGLSAHARAIAVIVAAGLVSGYLLDRFSNAEFPYIDSMTTWSAIWATFLVARKVLENWWYWLVIDIASIFIYCS